jgi:hypothetical protein
MLMHATFLAPPDLPFILQRTEPSEIIRLVAEGTPSVERIHSNRTGLGRKCGQSPSASVPDEHGVNYRTWGRPTEAYPYRRVSRRSAAPAFFGWSAPC